MKFRRKKGFSLIELIIVLSMMSIMVPSIALLISFIQSSNEKAEIQYVNSTLLAFVARSRECCKYEESLGYIEVNKSKGRIYLSINNEEVDGFNLPKGFTIYYPEVSGGNNIIAIDRDGYIKNAGKLRYKDKKGGTYYLSIGVGNSYAEIQK